MQNNAQNVHHKEPPMSEVEKETEIIWIVEARSPEALESAISKRLYQSRVTTRNSDHSRKDHFPEVKTASTALVTFGKKVRFVSTIVVEIKSQSHW